MNKRTKELYQHILLVLENSTEKHLNPAEVCSLVKLEFQSSFATLKRVENLLWRGVQDFHITIAWEVGKGAYFANLKTITT